MSTSNSVFATRTGTSSQSSSTTSLTRTTATAAGIPGISSGSGTCSLNVEEDSPSFGKVVWTNCCLKDNPELNCAPQSHRYTDCPIGYLNCADPVGHAEMCSAASDGSGYSDANPLNKKCCPGNFSCGLTWTSPCELIPGITNTTFPPYVNPEKVITNPLYLTVSGIFAGCNDANEISPSAVAAIVAVTIIGLCFLCGTVMWCIRRQIYRHPPKRVVRPKPQKVMPNKREGAKGLEIVVTRNYGIEGKDPNNESKIALPTQLDAQSDMPPSALWIDIGDAARMSRAIQRGTI